MGAAGRSLQGVHGSYTVRCTERCHVVIKFREVGCISCEMVHVTRRSIVAHLVADLANTDAEPLKLANVFPRLGASTAD